MLRVYKILRFLIVTAIFMVTVVPVGVYVALSLPQVQRGIASKLESELSDFLGVNVEVGNLAIVPFNRVAINGLNLITQDGDTIARVARVGAGVSVYSLIASDHISVNYLELIGLDAHINRAEPDAPLNIEPILRALAPTDTTKAPTPFDFRVNTIVIRRSQARYDVLSEPITDHFSPNHIAVSDLNADLRLPLMRNNDFTIDLKRLGFVEQSGLTVSELSGRFHISDTIFSAAGLSLQMPGSSLAFADMEMAVDGLKNAGNALHTEPLRLSIEPGSHVAVADFAAFMPRLASSNLVFDVEVEVTGNLEEAEVKTLRVSTSDHRTRIDISGEVNRPTLPDEMTLKLNSLKVTTTGLQASEIAMAFADLPPRVAEPIRQAGDVRLEATYDGTLKGGDLTTTLTTALGSVELDATAYHRSATIDDADIDLKISDVDLATILSDQRLGPVSAQLSATVARNGKQLTGPAELEIESAQLLGYTYHGLLTKAMFDGDRTDLEARIDDPALAFFVNATIKDDPREEGRRQYSLYSTLSRMQLDRMGLTDRYPGYTLSGRLTGRIAASSVDDVVGRLFVNDIAFLHPDLPGIEIYRTTLQAEADSTSRSITINSDVLEGSVKGQYTLSTLPDALADMVAQVYPVFVNDRPHQRLMAKRERKPSPPNHLTFKFSLNETERYQDFLRWPVRVLYPVEIEGTVDEAEQRAMVNVDAPFLRQKNKLIERTDVSCTLDGLARRASLSFSTQYPTKNGPMYITVDNEGTLNALHTTAQWEIERDNQYEGALDLTTTFSRLQRRDEEPEPPTGRRQHAAGADLPSTAGPLCVDLDINPSELVFNDAVWTINPARINYCNKHLAVDGIDVYRDNQFVKISGTASESPYDVLHLNLLNLNLDYVFETLGIDKVMLGGDATGEFEASQLFSSEPHIQTSGLDVSNISYNKQVFGDATVRSRWDPETSSIKLDAVISEPEGRMAYIDGAIAPLTEKLDLEFRVDHTPVGFLNPYMEAFAADVGGYASGRVRLFGTFKYVDMEGDVMAHDVNMKIRFTNTRYWATDSVHFAPGRINLDNITVRDDEGHTARLSGVVRHEFFKNPSFNINLTNARNFLSYKETPKENPIWYGRIYGNGSAHVEGYPGKVNITVDMTTAPRSTFTFVLSDMQEASEYSFLTFRDVTVVEATDTLEERANPMYLVNRFRNLINENADDQPSSYDIGLHMTITPDAQINLIMDPVAGDRIRTRGGGYLGLTYESANNELKMVGTYTVESGDYNFTLQDIIIKDFTLSEGGKIEFNGDPYAAKLDLQAVYSLNANLSDLDESFTQDADLNRTNVPVHALMHVSGDIREPEISFDLEFPTLTQDTYRKVKSIVSTDEMMNRQIIYLLALNRFYTPDYMGSQSRGGEMVSLASSTISSQLGNILGQLSDNWSIAPNFRSDRGDFSDMEVDVALSSRLLNNRLLFNGNFGYRDNALNTTQFIGDFDLEYLLNRRGNVRLKAYNRYNDQNYFLRTANTTQGVGVMFKHDFDNILGTLLRRKSTPSK